MRTVIFNFFVLISFGLFSQNIDLLPTSTTNQVIKHTYYTLSYSEKNEQAEWVAYKLTKDMTVKKVDRSGSFTPDLSVKTGSATNADYKNSGYDKGHLCPAADMSFSETAMKECFYLSNISPQLPGFNRGIWKSLEELVREWAIEYNQLYVVTGPVLKYISGTIGEDKVSVPKYFYKVLLKYDNKNFTALAFLIPNEKCNNSLQNYLVTIDSVEHITGIDFFPSLPDSIENRIESKVEAGNWDFSKTSITVNQKKTDKFDYDKPANEKYKGYQVFIGQKGGKYYINDKGKKVYLKGK